MAQITGSFDPILAPLHSVIARRRLRTVFRIVLACVVAILAVGLGLMIAERLELASVQPLPILVAVGIATALISTGIAFTRRRSVTKEAFFIDRATGFDEAYGTAVELAERAETASGPVPGQLMTAVRARLDQISASGLVRILTPGFMISLVLAIGLAFATWWLAGQPLPERPEIVSTAEAVPEPVSAETVSTIAEMLAEDAEKRADPLLEAIARTLAEHADAAVGAPIPEEFRDQINDLLDQAAAAYEDEVPSWLGTSEGMRLDQLEQALAALEAAEPIPPSATPLDTGVDTLYDPYYEPDDGPGLYDERPELSELYGDRENDEMSGAPEAAEPGSPMSNLDAGAPGEGPQLMQPEQLQSAGAIPVGAALESGRGESSLAGLGEEDLRADDAFSQLAAEPSEEMVVSAEPQAEGSRIRIEIVPQAGEGGPAGAAGAIGGQTGAGSTEPAPRDFVPATVRDLAARYFERIAQ